MMLSSLALAFGFHGISFSKLMSFSVQVVGEKEREQKTVNVRTRDNVVHGEHKLSEVVQVLLQEKAQRSLVSLFGGHGSGAEPAAPAPAQ